MLYLLNVFPSAAKSILLLVITLLSLSGCDNVTSKFETSMRSGTIANDDVEEPLSDKAKQYENALKLSNEFLALWQKREFQTIYDTMVDPEVQDKITVEKMSEIYQNVEKEFGKLVGYKENQWAFEPKKSKKQYFLFSIKSVSHTNKKLNYLFQFVLDDEYKKLAGFYVRERPALRAPGQIHNSKQ